MRNVKSKDEFESDEILFSESNQKIRHFRRLSEDENVRTKILRRF